MCEACPCPDIFCEIAHPMRETGSNHCSRELLNRIPCLCPVLVKQLLFRSVGRCSAVTRLGWHERLLPRTRLAEGEVSRHFVQTQIASEHYGLGGRFVPQCHHMTFQERSRLKHDVKHQTCETVGKLGWQMTLPTQADEATRACHSQVAVPSQQCRGREAVVRAHA